MLENFPNGFPIRVTNPREIRTGTDRVETLRVDGPGEVSLQTLVQATCTIAASIRESSLTGVVIPDYTTATAEYADDAVFQFEFICDGDELTEAVVRTLEQLRSPEATDLAIVTNGSVSGDAAQYIDSTGDCWAVKLS